MPWLGSVRAAVKGLLFNHKATIRKERQRYESKDTAHVAHHLCARPRADKRVQRGHDHALQRAAHRARTVGKAAVGADSRCRGGLLPQTRGLYRFDELVNGGLLADSLQKIPFSDGKSFDINVSTQISKTGKTIPLLECSASYNDYLKGLDSNAVKQLNEEANKTGSFPGLKIGDLDTPNNNAGNWE